MINKILGIFLLGLTLFLASCGDSNVSNPVVLPIDTSAKITFVELGSTNCVGCIMMESVMDSVKLLYGSKVSVVFIDVNKNPKEALPYKIRIMPTQVFLDSAGVECFRHENYFCLDSLEMFLNEKKIFRIKGK